MSFQHISKGFTTINYPENNGAFKYRLKSLVDELGCAYNMQLIEMSYDTNNPLSDKYMRMTIPNPPLVVNRFSHNISKEDTDMDIDNKDDINSNSETNLTIDENMATKEDNVEELDDNTKDKKV